LILVALMLLTAGIMIAAAREDGSIEEYSYDRTVKLTHYPDGRVEREEW